MSETLLSVGLDVGTTSTQLIFSRLLIENQAGSFSVPEMVIAQRTILYKSPVHFTPLLDESRVDAAALENLVAREYEQAGIRREDVDTGAIIITGETSRKENARTVLERLGGYAGDFVVTAAGPHLESVLAARGSGAVAWSESTGRQVLHMDIGGGTSNLALIREGKILKTGCLNVGGRLLKFQENGEISYISPVLSGIFQGKVGSIPSPSALEELAVTLTAALEMAAGLRPRTELLDTLWTREAGTPWTADGDCVLSFSGGVADCLERELPDLAFRDLGPILGRAIRGSRLYSGGCRLGEETIRATVIGAGCHSTQLSGSTVFHRNLQFPLKNVPVLRLPSGLPDGDTLSELVRSREVASFLTLSGPEGGDYGYVAALADTLARAVPEGPVLVCLEGDMAKALGQALALRLEKTRPILCIDRVKPGEDSYLDVGAPVGSALPVVVKTLVLNR